MESRLRTAFVVVVLLFLVVVARLFQLQIVEGAKYYRLAELNHIRKIIVPAPRGKILDRNGELLADSRPSFSLLLVPAETDSHAVATVAQILGLAPEELQERVARQEFGLAPVRLRSNADMTLVAQIEEHASEIPGIVVKREPRRYYLLGDTMAHVLGYVNEITESSLARDTSYRAGNTIGAAGLEAKYESLLRGYDGTRFVVVNAWGKEVGTLPERDEVAPRPGGELKVTLDAGLQRLCARLMAPYRQGAIVGLNLKDGGVLCLYSKPGFDPNLLSGAITVEQWQSLITDKETPFVNRALAGVYNPGSCLKPLAAIAGLRRGVLSQETRFQPCRGVFEYGRRRFRCTGSHGSLGLIQAIVKSCNVYFYQVGLKVGIDALAACYRDFGLGSPTGIDLPGERTGIAPDREWLDKRYGENKWSIGIALNLALGQGEVQVTPLQLAVAYAILAGNGKWFEPHILDCVRNSDGTVETFRPVARQISLDPGDMKIIREALLGVVREGTGTGAYVPGIAVSGKTGTAEHTGGADHAWFACYAGRQEPEVAFVVLVENGGKGGAVAAPIARELIKKHFGIKDPEPPANTLGADTADIRAEPQPEPSRGGALKRGKSR